MSIEWGEVIRYSIRDFLNLPFVDALISAILFEWGLCFFQKRPFSWKEVPPLLAMGFALKTVIK